MKTKLFNYLNQVISKVDDPTQWVVELEIAVNEFNKQFGTRYDGLDMAIEFISTQDCFR